MIVRPFSEKDFPDISEWCFKWRNKHIDRDMLSNHGFVACAVYDHIFLPVACAFLYVCSNSRSVQIGFPVSNPNAEISSRDRLDGLKAAISACHVTAVNIGAKHIVSVSDNPGIGRIYDKMGFKTPSEHRFHHWSGNKA